MRKKECCLFLILNLVLLLTVLSPSMCNESASISSQPVKSARIVGGVTTTIARVPYLVNLRSRGTFFCGGSLVTPRHVVTAAHCIKDVKTSTITVVGGATYLSETGVRRGVQNVFIPRSYDGKSMNMDVAVLKLSGPMQGPNINIIELCAGNGWKPGDEVRVSGWGQTTERRTSSSNQVRTVDVKLMSRATCKRKYQKSTTITKSMFCAAVPGEKDACIGDSGGPLVFRGRLCGIVSWGMGCAREKYPGVYTNVNIVKTFIQSAISK